mgnify:FL=1
MNNTERSGLAINHEATVKIAAIATMEVEGVASLGRRPIELSNIKSFLSGNRNDHSTAIGLSVDNGALLLNVYINVRDDVKVKAVAEEVQKNVKDKVQSMTGNAVARVNVYVDDMVITEKD